jgi:uncharacterized SAM-binding protein YcdF (DUF218 family)
MGMRSEPGWLSVGDAIVVFGAAVWPDGVASSTLKRRTLHAVDLHQNGAAPFIVLSGGLGRNPPTEAEVMASLCIEAGVEPAALILEDRSTTTFENVAFSAVILQKRGLRRVLAVSDAYHLPRIKMCFRYLGFDTVTSAPPKSSTPTRRRRIFMAWVREMAALPWYRMTLHRQLKATQETGRTGRA